MTDMMSGVENAEDSKPETGLDGLDEQLVAQLTKRLLESALEGEITDHLGDDTTRPLDLGRFLVIVALGEVLAEQAVGVLVGPALPQSVRVTEVALQAGRDLNPAEFARSGGPLSGDRAVVGQRRLGRGSCRSWRSTRSWTMRWKPALNTFEIAFDGRLAAGRK